MTNYDANLLTPFTGRASKATSQGERDRIMPKMAARRRKDATWTCPGFDCGREISGERDGHLCQACLDKAAAAIQGAEEISEATAPTSGRTSFAAIVEDIIALAGEGSEAAAAVRALPAGPNRVRAARTLLRGLRQKHDVPQDVPPPSRRRTSRSAAEATPAGIEALNHGPVVVPLASVDGDPIVRQIVEKLYGEDEVQSEPTELGEREQALLRRVYSSQDGLSVTRKSEREFDLQIVGPGYRAWLPLAALRLTDWTSDRITDQTDFPSMAKAGDWSAVRDTNRDALWQIFETELGGARLLGTSGRKGSKPAPRTVRIAAFTAAAKKVTAQASKKPAAKKSGKPAAAGRKSSSAIRGKSQVLGYGAAPLARWMGAQGWSFDQVVAVMAEFRVAMERRPLYHRFLEGRNAEKRAAAGKVDPIATPTAADAKALEARRSKVVAAAA